MLSLRSFLLFAVSAVAWAQADNDVSLAVSVLDAQRLPVQGIAVRVAASASSPALKEGATDATGQFRTSLPAGSYAVSVSGNQFRPETRTVSLISGQEAALEITVEPALLSQSVTVTDSPDSYNVPATSSATRTNTPLLDLPQSVQIISRKVIDDQQAFEYADAARYVSGVARATTSIVGAIGNELSIRGFELDPYNNYLRDGIKFPAFGVSDTADIERIEILKGPAAALYGRAEAGGVVNLVSKKPFEEPMFSIQFTGGNYDFYRPQFDISGPLNRSGTLLYRLNGVYENRGSFRDFVSGERYFAAPYLLWKPEEKTSLSVFGEFVNEDRVSDYGIPPLNGRPAPVPVSTYYDEPFNNEADRERQIGYVFQHQFGPNWSLQNSYRASRTNARYLEVYNTSVPAGTTLVRRTADAFAFPQLFQYSQTNLAGTVKTGPVRHTVLVGLELGWESGSSRGPGARVPPVDILHPVYGQVTSGMAAALLNNPDTPGRFVLGDETDNQITGGYAQDQVSLGRRIKVLAGARFERYAQDSISFIPYTVQHQSDVAVSPRIGLVYQPTSSVSLYASFVRSFLPTSPTALNRNNQQFSPEHDRQWEIGVKHSALQGRLRSTLSFFEIQTRNVLTPDPQDPRFSLQTGKQRSKGVEIDINGAVAPGWNMILSYAFIQAQIIADNSFPVGNLLPDAPRHSGALWTVYEWRRSRLRGLGLGGGLTATTARQGDLNNSFLLPGYARLDTALYYNYAATDRTNWRFSLKLENALDRTYYQSSNVNQIRPGAPVTVLAAVRWTRH